MPRPQTLRRQIDVLAVAFNEGSGARIEGRPLSHNPYVNLYGRACWNQGWRDVDENWGSEVRGRWPFQPLPAVSG